MARTRSQGPIPARRRVRARQVLSYTALIFVALGFTSPLIYMVATSLKAPNEVFAIPPNLVGAQLRWSNYVEAFNYAPFGRFITNAILYSCLGTLLNIAVAVLSGYAFARMTWPGRNLVFVIFLGSMLIPQDILVIPMFTMMRYVGWVNTVPGIVIPWAFGAFGAFLLRQFFKTLPRELSEAAAMDGAGPVRTFFSIMLPLARPTLAVLAVFTFVAYWNSFLWPLIIIDDVYELGTIPLGLQQFFGQAGEKWNLMMAASVISMLPTVLLVILLQRHLVKGIAAGGLSDR